MIRIDETIKLFETIKRFVSELSNRLIFSGENKFTQVEQIKLKRSMARCGMTEYPPVAGPEDGESADGSMICARCKHKFAHHPLDWRVIGYGDMPFLNILCDGRRVKL